MKFFVDSAQVDEIEAVNRLRLVDGVTTNPSLIAKSGRDFKEVIREICAITFGPVSAEVASYTYEDMIHEGQALAGLAENVVVKLPLTTEGLRAAATFSEKGIKTNLTLCFSASQALLAAKVGATYVSPFVGRIDDINTDGIQLLRDIRTIYNNYSFSTKILAASIRSLNHVTSAALAGADVATLPPSLIWKLAGHPLTDAGIKQFESDWARTGQSIL